MRIYQEGAGSGEDELDAQAVAVLATDPDEMLGANTPDELAALERGLAARGEPSAG